VLLAAGLLSGCGGSEEQEFADRANAMCRELERKIEAIPFVRPPTFEQEISRTAAARRVRERWAAYSAKTSAIGKEQQRRLKALEVPESLRDGYRRFRSHVAQLDRIGTAATRSSAQVEDALRRGDREAVEAAINASGPWMRRELELTKRINADVRALGWDDCAD
jgi:hypothetical protein